MKKQFLTFILLGVISFSIYGQSLEFTGSYGYQFGTKADYLYGYMKAQQSSQWGVSAGLEVQPNLIAKLSYVNMDTELRGRDFDYTNNREVRVSNLQNDWFLLGAQKYFKDGTIKPFAGAGLGFVIVSPKDINKSEFPSLNLNSSTFFAFNIEAGVNFMFTKNIGFNVQGNLYFPVNYGGFYIGTGGAGFTTGATQIIGGFSGGLVFRFNN